MTDTEKQIENIGYKIRVSDMLCNYVVYENKKEDQEIILEWMMKINIVCCFRKQYREKRIGSDIHDKCLRH